MDKKIIKIEGDRIYLRPLTEADATPEYLSWLNDGVTNKYLQTKRETMNGLRKYLHARVNHPDIFFTGIFDKTNDRHVGNVQLEIDSSQKKGAFGILIGNPQYRGKGVGTEVTSLVVQYAFKVRGLKEVWLSVEAENIAGRRAYEKVGFQITEKPQEDISPDGKVSTRVTMSIKNPQQK